MKQYYRYRQINVTGGFSLIEMMMALGVLGIVMTGFATYVTSATRAQKAISVKMDRQDFRNLISISPSTSLTFQDKCAADIGSKLPAFNNWANTPSFTLPNTTILNQYNSDGTVFNSLANLGTGAIFGTTQLRINSITVTGLDQATALPVAPNLVNKLIMLRFNVQPTDASLASLATFILPMNLSINSAGAVTGCKSSIDAATPPAAAPLPAATPTPPAGTIGGSFMSWVTQSHDLYNCIKPNPATGACSCPSGGYTTIRTAVIDSSGTGTYLYLFLCEKT
ncbi:MAG: type II secretion system protein [Bdellovibrionales bacterium]